IFRFGIASKSEFPK
ncbi:hypothetical protein Zm00014a_033185, partial [Zea mays]